MPRGAAPRGSVDPIAIGGWDRVVKLFPEFVPTDSVRL